MFVNQRLVAGCTIWNYFRSFCASSSYAAVAGLFGTNVNNVTLPREVAISEAGLGPAWSMPSLRTDTSELSDRPDLAAEVAFAFLGEGNDKNLDSRD
jgi:hypothetical protein